VLWSHVKLNQVLTKVRRFERSVGDCETCDHDWDGNPSDAFRTTSVPLGSAGIRAGCIAPIAMPTGTLIRPLEAASATRLNESPLHPLVNRYPPSPKPAHSVLARRVRRKLMVFRPLPLEMGQALEPGPRAGLQWPGPLELW
jgi:hypothetical protein